MTEISQPDGAVAETRKTFDDSTPLKLFYGGSIVVQLGSQLYPSVTASVAELISNAWDADAANVWVSVPLDDSWDRATAEIEVLDDGVGMSREAAQFSYLVIGRERRSEERTDRTTGRNRRLHGRKGIGKLAAFGTGRVLEVVTLESGGRPVGFRLDYNQLRQLEPGESPRIQELKAHEIEPLTDPDGAPMAQGTRVRLSDLQAKRRPNKNRFMLSMRRRFALDEDEMRVVINGEVLRRFDMDFALKFPRDGAPRDAERVDDDLFVIDLVDDGTGAKKEVKWWIGFSAKPVRDELLQGVTVLVHGKQAQRAFKFERTGGTQGQLGYEYLVGEVHADWIDDGFDEDDDLISSDRDSLQVEDERLQPFMDWGRKRLVWAIAQRDSHARSERVVRWRDEMPALRSLLDEVTGREQQALGQVAERLSRVSGVEDRDVAEVMRRVLDSREQRTRTRMVEDLRAVGDTASNETWSVVDEFAVSERALLRSSVQARLAVIESLGELLLDGARPPDLAEAVHRHPWILDLAFDRSHVRRLRASKEAGEAVILVGPAPWAPEDPSTLVACFWETGAPGDDDWLQAVESVEIPDHTGRLLISRESCAFKGVACRTWDQTLSRSAHQHRAWHDVLAGS